MFPVPSFQTNAAAQQYGAAKQAQEDKLHEQNHPEQAQAEENTKLASKGQLPTPNGSADGKAAAAGGSAANPEDSAKTEAEKGTKEILKAVNSSFMTHI